MITRRYILDLYDSGLSHPLLDLGQCRGQDVAPFPAGSGDGSGEKVSAGWNAGQLLTLERLRGVQNQNFEIEIEK